MKKNLLFSLFALVALGSIVQPVNAVSATKIAASSFCGGIAGVATGIVAAALLKRDNQHDIIASALGLGLLLIPLLGSAPTPIENPRDDKIYDTVNLGTCTVATFATTALLTHNYSDGILSCIWPLVLTFGHSLR